MSVETPTTSEPVEMEPEFIHPGGFQMRNPRFGQPLQPPPEVPSIEAPKDVPPPEVDQGDCDACNQRPSVQGKP